MCPSDLSQSEAQTGLVPHEEDEESEEEQQQLQLLLESSRKELLEMVMKRPSFPDREAFCLLLSQPGISFLLLDSLLMKFNLVMVEKTADMIASVKVDVLRVLEAVKLKRRLVGGKVQEAGGPVTKGGACSRTPVSSSIHQPKAVGGVDATGMAMLQQILAQSKALLLALKASMEDPVVVLDAIVDVQALIADEQDPITAEA